MKNALRHILWKFLGINYYFFLKKQKKVYLDKAKNTTIGYKTYHNGAFVWQWYDQSFLRIGSYCSISNEVNFVLDTGFHQLSEVTSFPHMNHMNHPYDIQNMTIASFIENNQLPKGNISVGNDVWIGMNAIILPNVNVGNGVTIMAGAIVTRDVPDYAVVAGVPARVIKMKHSEDIIQKLNVISWWNWDPDKVEKNCSDFYLPIEEFIKKWE